MISRQAILRGYQISVKKFSAMLHSLPDKTKKQLNLKRRQYYFKPYQVHIIVDQFGDYENGRFLDKGRFAKNYGLGARGMRNMIIDEFGEASKLLHGNRYFSPKEQQMIIDKIGKW